MTNKSNMPLEDFEDTKGVIIMCNSKKNREHNGPQKITKDNQRSIEHTHKTKRINTACLNAKQNKINTTWLN
jgi:hypothetical protein